MRKVNKVANAIEVNQLNYKVENLQLKNISFEVKKGYVTGFIGANGSGKTTIIRIIMGLLKEQSGDLKLLGEYLTANPVEIKNKIGFVYSELYMYENWNIKTIESVVSKYYKNWDHDMFQKYMNQFQLPYKQKIKQFSTGMKMKLSLAIALSHHAELYILDEPTAGLDPVVRNEVLEILQKELIDEDKTIFFSTHIISDLEKIADYIVYLKDGSIVINESVDELIEGYKIIKGDSAILDDELRELLISIKETHTGFSGLTNQSSVFVELFGNDIVVETPSIEDIMVRIEKDKFNKEVV
ncbi:MULTISPECIES: phenol-soluble modulin export ABC transporter ATP-binding protein PmtA [Mammaliicoccus]|uniref:ABC transporter ATP-binding protein n=1 Tax=Mammaliicoccus fleurettii TaxID=150056 RepID=A0ABS5MNV9_9STAP|nr:MULTISPECIES: ABC transporter ATP-binding protein [Mammaliicoccus]HCN60133.1 ABC transporter ATP-binding protein [Staphylococcus sp.]MBL0847552.1 ABC transporter ATP-binding protein [Mammaliicoccus fleurettii]MBS3672475.1 ABC transporter ATP-binding protein [Mammaliicoccus fleurettii]MBS3697344.1 ABC transporter ATP-binding protein [Mammaliicoccus fleurettii]MEB6202413.1 ABC transporter ATP-binding protein [Mammaliicoccus fleurettii]